ncbi:hypothetical protein AB0I61_17360 [Polymorphospora rubra]|uniref:phage tail tube protein n=1 Tax=Polymorphospora rubra TaxID=338584 RepID=UPI00340EAFE4
MAKNVDNVRVYGDIDSGVWVGPVGTTAPTSPITAPGVGWVELGWLGEDGITETREVSSDPKRAWQGGVTVRTVRANDSRRFTVIALETNATVAGLVRPGSVPTTAAGITHTPVRAFTGSDNRAWIIDTRDGAVDTRKVIARGEVVEVGDVAYQGSEITAYELTIECYPDSNGVLYDEYTNDPALAVPDEG